MALDELGLTTDDVTIQQVGGQSARIAALIAGSVQAAPVDETRRQEMTDQGLNVLVQLGGTDREVAIVGVTMREEWVQQNPNTTLALVAALLEAQTMILADEEAAVDQWMKVSQSTDREAATTDVRGFTSLASKDLRWTQEGFEILRDVLATQNPAMADVNVADAYTFEFLDKLRDMGFNEKIGAPAS
jgi:ABC-type nitrate/sulfonate/bicarbonate transport system substrate-binding protein